MKILELDLWPNHLPILDDIGNVWLISFTTSFNTDVKCASYEAMILWLQSVFSGIFPTSFTKTESAFSRSWTPSQPRTSMMVKACSRSTPCGCVYSCDSVTSVLTLDLQYVRVQGRRCSLQSRPMGLCYTKRHGRTSSGRWVELILPSRIVL